MITKIKQWMQLWKLKRNRKAANAKVFIEGKGDFYTREQLEKSYALGYNDGKRDGLAIAREQATKSLKEILWREQKQTNQMKK